jgi:molecular chaperone DnaK
MPRSGDVAVLVTAIEQLRSACDRDDEQEEIERLSAALEVITERVLRWKPELAHTFADIGLCEVTAKPLGIAVLDRESQESLQVIIPAGTPYPLAHPYQKTFYSSAERLIRIPVYEGNDPIADRNELQGLVECSLPEIIPIGTPVSVSFDYDRDRVLRVTVDVIGYPEVWSQQPLLRGSLRNMTAESKSAGGPADLRATVEATEPLLAKYGQYLAPAAAARIRSDIQRAKVILDQGDPYPAKAVMSSLIEDVMSSDLGVLLIAEQIMPYLSSEDADICRQILTRFRTAHDADQSKIAEKELKSLYATLERYLQRRSISAAEVNRDLCLMSIYSMDISPHDSSGLLRSQ